MQIHSIDIRPYATTDPSALQRADGAEAAKMLETVFATMLVKEMRRALPDGFFGKGAGAGVLEGFLDEHLGKALAEDGALEIAGMVKAGLEQKDKGDIR